MKTRLLLLAVVATAMLAAPAVASANDYCVGSPAGCSGTDEGTDLQQALDDAKNNPGADRVLIGPGTYTRLDGFDYSDLTFANTAEIRGVGSPKPTLTMTTSGMNKSVLNISQSGTTVSDLAIDLPPSAFQGRGLMMQGGNIAQNLTVTGSAPSPPALQTGISMGASDLRSSEIRVDTLNGVAIYLSSAAPGSVWDTTAVGLRAIDLVVPAASTATLRRDTLSGTQAGLFMYYGDVDLDNSVIDLRGGGGAGIYMDTVTGINDSNTIDANELTIRNGNASSVGIRQTNNDINSTQTINLRDSIIWDVGHPFEQATPASGSTYTINSFLNDYDPANNLPLAGSLLPGQARSETSISTVDPGFLNPVSGSNGLSGDYRLAFDSPLLDMDPTPGLLYTGETDIRGLDRIVAGASPFTNSKRDFGAYEYQHAAPNAAVAAAPGSASPGQAITFDGSGSSDVDGDALTYAWTFDDGGTATGAVVSHAFAGAGTHTGTLTVTDATGLTGSSMASVSVTAPPNATATGPTGQQAAALRKCKKIKNKAKRRKCKKRAKRLPL